MNDNSKKVYTVSEINSIVRQAVLSTSGLRNIDVKGEVIGCKVSGGNMYFTLKDRGQKISCFMWRSDVARLGAPVEDGKEVIVSGYVDVFERDGTYSLNAKRIVIAGLGAINEELLRLKQRLFEEGLFDHEHKLPIPKHPKSVGIVTSGNGMAVGDIVSTIKQRNPYVQTYLYAANVQGANAVNAIVKGIRKFNELGVDTIIIGRGGGSKNDLLAFNDEAIVRAIYDSKIPIIAGTGHNQDVTLADYAADDRAITPTEAGVKAVFDVMTDIKNLDYYRQSMHNSMNAKLRLCMARIDLFATKLEGNSPKARLDNQQSRLSDLQLRMKNLMDKKYSLSANRLEVLTARLNGLSPTAKLVGGFGFIETEGKPLTSVKDVSSGSKITISISDGTVNATVD